MTRGLHVGDVAPDFELEGTGGTFRLSEHRGKRVVLLFYPGDDTPVCTRQFCSYRDKADDMAGLDATVVGISAQGLESHESFIARHGLTIPLLADVDRVVAKAYGVSRALLGTQRAAFVIDEHGRVAWRKLHALGLDYVSVEQLAEVLTGLGTGTGTPTPQ